MTTTAKERAAKKVAQRKQKDKEVSQELKEVFGESEIVDLERAFTATRDALSLLLDQGRISEKDHKDAEYLVRQFLFSIGKPFCCGGLGYILPELPAGQTTRGVQSGVPIAITKDGQDFNFLLYKIGIHPGTKMRDRIGKFLGTMCYQFGTKTEARISFHYDTERGAAYFAEGLGQLIKVTAREITRVPNGTDGQLFLFGADYEPWTYCPPTEPDWPVTPDPDFDEDRTAIDFCPQVGVLLTDLLFSVLEFENPSLTTDDIHMLLSAYITTLFLPGIITGKLLLQVLGESGSAKTLFLRMLGRLVYGKRFQVTGLDTDEKQVENALVNNSFVVFDDVKRTSNAAIMGMIRRACTGGSAKRRELYSTFGQIEEPFRAAVALTCSEEPFHASDEMSNRSLVIKAKAREDFLAEENLLRRISDNRDALMSEMMMRTRSVILAIDAQRHYEPTVKIRMASFATFLLRVARNGEWSERAQQVLEAWQEEQQGGTLDQAITDVLDNWMRLPNFEPGKRYDAIGLERELTGVANHMGFAPWWLGKVRWLTRALRSASRAYRNRYGFGFSERTSGHRAPQYWFEPDAAVLKELRAGSQEKQEKIPF